MIVLVIALFFGFGLAIKPAIEYDRNQRQEHTK